MPERRYRSRSEKTTIDRLMARFAYSRLGGLLFITVFPAIDRRLMRLSGGRLKIAMGQPVLLLHARGAKSGQPRLTPLLYTPRGEELIPRRFEGRHRAPPVVIPQPHGPSRRRGRAGRRADRRDGTRGCRCRARGALESGQRQLPGYDVYQRRAAARRIPIMILTPRRAPSAQP